MCNLVLDFRKSKIPKITHFDPYWPLFCCQKSAQQLVSFWFFSSSSEDLFTWKFICSLCGGLSSSWYFCFIFVNFFITAFSQPQSAPVATFFCSPLVTLSILLLVSNCLCFVPLSFLRFPLDSLVYSSHSRLLLFYLCHLLAVCLCLCNSSPVLACWLLLLSNIAWACWFIHCLILPCS